ncbi:SixA phosphatase family protein [Citreimonas salinaria]|uniref:Phosphohistidine phosphatase n=1 Tax=Citreimonas salinaria TaxID=321339 RepID=A0A1H3KIA4_9RHOB|nr:histidine phosphatase family protein [Citreimonas salinaria]SDY51760.1 phosphohistidine phosphatase [Citreimonas salinaria]
MRRLVLMRHAKSDWSQTAADHDRPLNARGVRAARALGDWLRRDALLPDAAMVSTARRTRESWGLLALDAPARFLHDLYDADAGDMIDALRRASGPTVLLLGHNPAIGDVGRMLLGEAPAHDRFDDYPTGATLVADFDVEGWAAIEPGTGTAVTFVIPADLPET